METKTSPQKVLKDQLIGKGQFQIDKAFMSAKISTELAKICDEKMRPFKLYVSESAKLLGIFLTALAISFGMCALGRYYDLHDHESTYTIFFVFGGIGSWASMLGVICTANEHTFLIVPLLKMRRAEKLFKRISQELHSDVMEGGVDVSNLKKEFKKKENKILEKTREIIEQAETIQRKEWRDRQVRRALVNRAKNSKI